MDWEKSRDGASIDYVSGNLLMVIMRMGFVIEKEQRSLRLEERLRRDNLGRGKEKKVEEA